MATFTVGSSPDNDYTTISDVFSNEDLGPADIVEIWADEPGGEKTYTETVQPGTNDVGSALNPIVIKPRSGDTIIINGAGGLYAWYQIRNYYDFQDLTFRNGSVYTFRCNASTGLTFERCTFDGSETGAFYQPNQDIAGLEFTDCIFENAGSQYGLRLQANVINGVFNNCIFRNNWIGGLRTDTAKTSMTFNDCFFYNNGLSGVGDGVINETDTTQNITYNDCFAYNNRRHGFYFSNANGITANRCVAFDNREDDGTNHHNFCSANADDCTYDGCYSIRGDYNFVIQDASDNNIYKNCVGIDPQFGFSFYSNNANTNSKIHNCAFIQPNSPAVAQIDGGDTGWEIRNTVFLHQGGGDVINLESGAAYPDSDYNCFYSSKSQSFSDKGTDRNFSSWKTTSSQDDNSIFNNPLINDEGRILVNSLCLNNGVFVSGVNDDGSTDRFGNQVIGVPNIGADQFVFDESRPEQLFSNILFSSTMNRKVL